MSDFKNEALQQPSEVNMDHPFSMFHKRGKGKPDSQELKGRVGKLAQKPSRGFVERVVWQVQPQFSLNVESQVRSLCFLFSNFLSAFLRQEKNIFRLKTL